MTPTWSSSSSGSDALQQQLQLVAAAARMNRLAASNPLLAAGLHMRLLWFCVSLSYVGFLSCVHQILRLLDVQDLGNSESPV